MRHIIDTHFEPSFIEIDEMASYDVASTIHQSLAIGDFKTLMAEA